MSPQDSTPTLYLTDALWCIHMHKHTQTHTHINAFECLINVLLLKPKRQRGVNSEVVAWQLNYTGKKNVPLFSHSLLGSSGTNTHSSTTSCKPWHPETLTLAINTCLNPKHYLLLTFNLIKHNYICCVFYIDFTYCTPSFFLFACFNAVTRVYGSV